MPTLETEIEDHMGDSVLGLAASLMIEIRVDGDNVSANFYRASLAAIRSQLVGAIAEDADRVLAQRASEGDAA